MQFRSAFVTLAIGLGLSSVTSLACIRSAGRPRDVAELSGGGAIGSSYGAVVVRQDDMEQAIVLDKVADSARRAREFDEARAISDKERFARERGQLGLMLRAAADGVSRKTHALEKSADATRGVSQATLYKALEALESQRAILSDLSERVETVPPSDWDEFKEESEQILDNVREPEAEDTPD